MNINEEMGQLGQIGSTGYHPSDTVVDHLVTKTKRARAFRQGSAALVGSLGAVALGLIGAQVFVNLTQDQDAGKIPIRDLAFNNMTFEELHGKGYTGLGKSPEELAAAWKKVQDGAKIVPAAPAPAAPAPAPAPAPEPAKPAPVTCAYETKEKDGWIYYKSTETGCVWTKKEPIEEPTVPAGYIDVYGVVAECRWYVDAASNTEFFAAYANAGSWVKMALCKGSYPTYTLGTYRHIEGMATLDGSTCVGVIHDYYGAPKQFSCNPAKDTWIIDTVNYKMFSGDGLYHCIAETFVWGDKTWYWTGSTWAEVPPEPEPEPAA